MKKIQVELDEKTFEQAQLLAEAQHFTLEAWLQRLIERQIVLTKGEDPLLGMFADEPDLIDDIINSTMKAREIHPLRQANGESIT